MKQTPRFLLLPSFLLRLFLSKPDPTILPPFVLPSFVFSLFQSHYNRHHSVSLSTDA
ncbi:hypothetical protein RND81_07G098700 [Saponaria officinalis]|uniref:Uncharacterized protein n=1 Tax=Saponaria officinalis TaxID=3572 RepID=A0AAW1JP59_SAPOF